MTTEEASAIAGIAMSVFFGLATGVVDSLGLVIDRSGRKRSVVTTVYQGALLFLAVPMARGSMELYLAATLSLTSSGKGEPQRCLRVA